MQCIVIEEFEKFIDSYLQGCQNVLKLQSRKKMHRY